MQVYASRAFSWRGAFADHTWLAAKPEGAEHYTRYEVIGWYGGGGRSVVSVSDDRAPDAEWFGAAPRLIRDVRGADAAAIIGQIAAGDQRLSLWRYVQRVARSQQQHVRRASRPRNTRNCA